MARPPRYRTLDGTIVPGVTTILSRYKDATPLMIWAHKQGLEGKDWRETRDAAAEAGTMAHAAVEAHIHGIDFQWPRTPENEELGIDSDVVTKAKGAFRAFLEWADQTQLKVTHTEVSMVSEKYKFGGTLDAMLIRGKRSLGDWKSSNGIYQEYMMQVAAYGILWEEHYPDMPIDGGYHLLRFDKSYGDFHHHFWAELETAKKAFLMMRELYEMDKELRARAK